VIEHDIPVAVSLGRYGPGSRALERLKERLHGKTYMNFRIYGCPAGGEDEIWAETSYAATESEIKEFLLYVLASDVALGKE
jgi:hypothetical protein